jgi:pimeloyl-ACP methyl ester carboxylesterase
MAELMIEKTLTREGCTLHYWVSQGPADSPWLLLLHGAATDHGMFTSQYAALAGQYNLIAPDIRGAGLSRPMGATLSAALMVDDTLAMLDCEGISTVSVIGHSLGGNLAQEIVYRHPARVSCLVFIDCTCNTMKLTSIEKFAVWCSPAIFAVYPPRALINQSAAVSAIRPEVQEYLKKTMGTVGKKDFITIMNTGTTSFLHEDDSYRINKPMLLVCGEADGTGNIRKCAPIWAKREPQCEFHMLKNAGHCAHMDRPEEFNRLLVEYLARQVKKIDE